MLLLLLLTIFMTSCISLNTMESFKADEIVPQIIDEAPNSKLSVKYPNGKEVNLGSELTPREVKDEPKVEWQADPNKYYTLAKIDPDAPSRKEPKLRCVKHWLVGNIKGGNVASGKVIAEYRGSRAPKGSGLHRYIFLLYEQNDKIEYNEPFSPTNSTEHRHHFSIKKFAMKYNLKLIAGNYYQAQHDSYVDEINGS